MKATTVTTPPTTATAIPPTEVHRVHEARHGRFLLSTDPRKLDIDLVHSFLANDSYWARGIERDLLFKAISNSLPIGVYDEAGSQVAFGRVVTDRALFAYLRDVFVVAQARGQGVGTFIAREAIAHPDLVDVRRWMLATEDAHGVYQKVGFGPVENPEWYMALNRPANKMNLEACDTRDALGRRED